MKRILLLVSVLVLCCCGLKAQGQLAEQQPGTLFAYPMAPDTCSTLEERCNYIITHFWEPFDFSRQITDEEAFERTFRDYVDFFRYAHRNVVLSTVRDFVNKAQANTSNLKKVGDVAERALYGSDAEYWSDEVYVAFIKPLAGNKALPKEVRENYATQLARINAVQVGAVLDLDYTGLDGAKHRLSELPEAKNYILLFVDGSTDSTIGRLRLSTDVAVNNLLASGETVIVCLSTNKFSSEWASGAAGYADNWTIGCGDNLMSTLDLRVLPCCYLLDGERTIVSKSLSVENLISAVNPMY
ncbi:MAG: DUF5106 domain-containing protein [Muribaculaceae bacterium]|nr:DUF5106 domain-containing protein [Muribaculaceae bacterium]